MMLKFIVAGGLIDASSLGLKVSAVVTPKNVCTPSNAKCSGSCFEDTSQQCLSFPLPQIWWGSGFCVLRVGFGE